MKNRYVKTICFFIIFLLCFSPQMLSAENSTSDSSSALQAQNGAETTDMDRQGSQKTLELHAFYPAYITFTPDLEKFIDRLDSVSFAWCRLFADSLESLSTVKGVHKNFDFYYPKDYIQPVKYAKSKGKSIQLSVYSDFNEMSLILPDENKRNKVIETIIKALGEDISGGEAIYFDGVVIDFESFRNTDAKGKDILVGTLHISDYFNIFLNVLNTELEKLNKKLYVAVNPRLNYNGYDYREIIKIADKMIIMGHDYEDRTNPIRKDQALQYTGYNSINPIDSLAPINKIKVALEDAKNNVDSIEQLGKVWLQISFGSAQWQFDIPNNRDWDSLENSSLSKSKKTTATYAMIKNRIDNSDGLGANITYNYNNVLQSPSIQYFNTQKRIHNVIIYEDSNSVKAKIDMAKLYNISGISLWRIGSIPDYNDSSGKKFHLDVWDNILTSLQLTEAGEIKQKEKIQFIDGIIEEAVRKRIGKISGDIYKEDIEGIYRFKVPQGVRTITDLSMLTNLEYLDAQNLTLKDIKVLGSLSNLRVLYLQRNQISDISPLKALSKLEILSLNGNKVSDISPLAKLKSLKELYLGENQISNITALAGMTGLGKLNLNSNKIMKINIISQLKGLYELSFEGNLVSDLKPLEKLTKMIYLNGAGNKIVNVDPLKNLKNLESLYLQRNNIRDIKALIEMRELKALCLAGNKLKGMNTYKMNFPKLVKSDF